MLRLFPGQAAAEDASATAQLDRHQIVVGLREARAGKPHQHAALLDPGVETFADFRRQRADIGRDDHRQFLVEKLRDHLLRRAAVAKPDIGERRQRAGEIEGRGEQRLRGVAGRSRDHADGAPPPALVEQLHRAGRALAGYFEPRDVVAQFDGQVECGFGLAILHPEGVARLADRRTLGIDRAHHAGANACRGAQHLYRHFGGGVFRSRQRQRGGRAAFKDRQRALADGLGEAFEKFRAASGVGAVGQPRDLAIAGGFQEALDRHQRFDAFHRIGFWRDLAQRHARGAARHQGDVARRFGQRNQRHAAAVIVGLGDQFVGGLDPRFPARSRAPAVVEQNHQRGVAAAEARLRIPGRSGQRDDHQRRCGQPQQGQPPRRARGGLFLRRDIEQQFCRREFDAARPRRHHAQQPPQHRQGEQSGQQERFGKGERETCDHALRPAFTVERAPPLLTIMPECRNSNSSAAERLVVWVENSQSSLLVSARISSRCRATRAT